MWRHAFRTDGIRRAVSFWAIACFLLIGSFFSSGLEAQQTSVASNPLSTWHDRTPTNRNISFQRIVFAGDRFLVLGYRRTNFNHIWTSPDGVSWTGHSTGTTNYEFSSVAFGNNTFIATGCAPLNGDMRRPLFGTTIVISTNGNDWTPLPLHGSPFTEVGKTYVGQVAFGNGQFLMLGNEPSSQGFRKLLAWTSSDGRNWKTHPLNLIWPADQLFYLGDRFVSIDTIGRVLSIHDIELWSRTSNRGAQLAKLKVFAPLAAATYGQGKFVVAGDTWDDAIIATSADAKEWAITTIANTPHPPPNRASLLAIAFGGDTFLATGFNCTVVTSKNGTDWKHLTVSTNRSYGSVAYGKGTFLLVGGNSEILQSDSVQ